MLFYFSIFVLFLVVSGGLTDEEEGEDSGCIRTRVILEPCYGQVERPEIGAKGKKKRPLHLKSKAEICELNIGQQNGEPRAECPFEQITECQRRLAITLQLTNSGMTNQKEQYIILDHAWDMLYKERVSLLNPLIVKIKQTQLHELYPMQFTKRVNGAPKEVVIPASKGSIVAGNKQKRFCTNDIAFCDQILDDYQDQPKEGFCCSGNNKFNEMMELERLKAVENAKNKYNEPDLLMEFPKKHYDQIQRMKRQVRSLEEASKAVLLSYTDMPKRQTENDTQTHAGNSSTPQPTLENDVNNTKKEPSKRQRNINYSSRDDYQQLIEDSKNSARNFIEIYLKSIDMNNRNRSENKIGKSSNLDQENNVRSGIEEVWNSRLVKREQQQDGQMVNESKKMEVNKPVDFESENKPHNKSNPCGVNMGQIIKGIEIKTESLAHDLVVPHDDTMKDLIKQAHAGNKHQASTESPIKKKDDYHDRRRKEIALLKAKDFLHAKGQRVDACVGDHRYEIYRCGKFIKDKHKKCQINNKRKRRMIAKNDPRNRLGRIPFGQGGRDFRDTGKKVEFEKSMNMFGNDNCMEKCMGDASGNFNMSREQSFNGDTTAHCLKYSNAWFNEYSIGKPYIQHNVYIQVFERVARPDGSHEWIERTDGKTVTISSLTPCVADKGITLSYLSLETECKTPVLDYNGKNILVLDDVAKDASGREKSGPAEYLVVPKSSTDAGAKVTGYAHKCDRPGVTLQAFISQPRRCSREIGSCLRNQPLELLRRDREMLAEGRRPRFFLGAYGSIPPRPIREIDESMFLALDYERKHKSNLDIAMISDLNLPVSQNSLHGRVTAVFTESTYSQFTEITILVTNTALAMGAFRPRLVGCPSSAGNAWLDEGPPFGFTTISAHHTYEFRQRVEGKVGHFTCQLQVVNVDEVIIAIREFVVSSGKRCVCAWHCQCVCQSHNTPEAHLVCTQISLQDFHKAGYFGDLPPNKGQWPCDLYCHLILLLLLIMLLFLVAALIKCCVAYYEYKTNSKLCIRCCRNIKKQEKDVEESKKNSCHFCCTSGKTKCFDSIGSKIKSWFKRKPSCYQKKRLEEETNPKHEKQKKCFGSKNRDTLQMNVLGVNEPNYVGLTTSSGEEAQWIHAQQAASKRRLDDWRQKNVSAKGNNLNSPIVDENWTDWVIEQQVKSQNRLSSKKIQNNIVKKSSPDASGSSSSSSGRVSTSGAYSDTESEISISCSVTTSSSSINISPRGSSRSDNST